MEQRAKTEKPIDHFYIGSHTGILPTHQNNFTNDIGKSVSYGVTESEFD